MYLTRYALSSGGKIDKVSGDIFEAKYLSCENSGFYRINSDVFADPKDAIADAERRRIKAVKSAEKSIAKLKAMKFTVET